MIDKKKIAALVVFVFFGLFMYAFASPNEQELQPVDNNGTNNTTDNGNTNINNNQNNGPVLQMPVITLGTNDDTIEVFSEIPEFNATATNGGVISFTHNINNEVVGEYIVTARATNAVGTASQNFTFKVVDTTKPVIVLNGKDEIIRMDDKYTDKGVKATDNYDGDITSKVVTASTLKNKKGEYIITYNVTDANGNVAEEVKRNVVVTDASELNKAIDNADKFSNIDNKKTRKDLEDLLEELKDAVEEGKKVEKDHESTQEEIDEATKKINDILDELNNLVFTVKYLDFDSSLIKSYEVKLLENAPVPSDPTRTGYTFTNWDKVAKNVTDDMDIKAEYKINSYELIINADDGIKNIKVNGKALADSYNYDKKIIITYEVKKGYKNVTTDSVKFNMPASNKEVNLKSELISYNIKYVLNGGTVSTANPTTYTVLDTFKLNNPTREGYTFLGWNLLGKNVTISNTTGNKVFEAIWKVNTYSIKFGNVKAFYNYNSKIIYPLNPYKVGYTFKGWYEGENKFTETRMPARNVELTPKFEINKYTVSYYDENKKLIAQDKDVEFGTNYTVDRAYKLPKDTKQYEYSFAGWYNILGQKVTKATICSDVALYAKVNKKVKKYEVVFKDGNKVLAKQNIEYGKSAKVPVNPTKDHYDFIGWDKNFNYITGPLVVNAKWEATTYSIKFGTEKSYYKYNSLISYPSEPSKNGYTFDGWYEGERKFTETTMPGRNVELTPKFIPNEYYVFYYDENGNYIAKEKVHHDEKFKVTREYKNVPEDTAEYNYGYVWQDKNGNVVTEKIITGNLKLYAKVTMKIREYKVIFKDGENELDKQTVKYGESAKTPKVPTKEHYNFIGWDKKYNYITGPLVVNAKWEALQVGIKVYVKDGSSLVFEKDTKNATNELKTRIIVKEEYADGSEKEIISYTISNFDVTEAGSKEFNVEENGFTTTKGYTVKEKEQPKSKLSVKYLTGDYRLTSKGQCTNNCAGRKETNTSTKNNGGFIEITSNYDKNINITKVTAVIENEEKVLDVSPIVRWENYKNNYYKNAVFVAGLGMTYKHERDYYFTKGLNSGLSIKITYTYNGKQYTDTFNL